MTHPKSVFAKIGENQNLLVTSFYLWTAELNKIPLPRPVSFLLELVRWTQVLNRRSHELLHAIYATPPSVLSTDAVNNINNAVNNINNAVTNN